MFNELATASLATITAFGFLICALAMAISWVWAYSKSFYSLVDAMWAFGIGGLTALYFLIHDPWTLEKLVGFALILVWSGRLGSHLTRRLVQHFPREDRRYAELRVQWKENLALKSFLFFLFQALTQCFFAFPFLALAASSQGQISSFFWVGALISAIGLMGESLADAQLKTFVSDPVNRGAVCDLGLWRYSRHPNYFFEWTVWIGFGAMGAAAPGGWFSITCPCVMWVLLLFVTGVPPAEASSLQSKGQLYKDYRARTSKFVPWFPKSNHHRPQENV